MNKRDLLELLSDLPDHAEVYVARDDGNTQYPLLDVSYATGKGLFGDNENMGTGVLLLFSYPALEDKTDEELEMEKLKCPNCGEEL